MLAQGDRAQGGQGEPDLLCLKTTLVVPLGASPWPGHPGCLALTWVGIRVEAGLRPTTGVLPQGFSEGSWPPFSTPVPVKACSFPWLTWGHQSRFLGCPQSDSDTQ